MLKLSKKCEYGLMAVRYLAFNSEKKYSTAREISEYYDIPYELVAKVLQKLARKRVIASYQGVGGGYILTRSPEYISIDEVINAIEDNYKITDCMTENGSKSECNLVQNCKIRNPLIKLQEEVDKLFQNMKITQIL